MSWKRYRTFLPKGFPSPCLPSLQTPQRYLLLQQHSPCALGINNHFKFIRAQDSQVCGLSERNRNKRRTRNLVTIKFNLLSWILDTTSILLVIISKHFNILYLLVNSCGPPVIYFLGMEENRIITINYFISCMRVFKRNG